MLNGYKYRLHPTSEQADFLVRTIGCARFIYNKLLEDRIAIHEEAKAETGAALALPQEARQPEPREGAAPIGQKA
ncbi:helix-turn-helix domain-containing protein [Exiguobacterium sp. SH5S13]|uniref:helix-turn-helix domain-containing protein n=1 Tax=Exiguobacterium sp. SH5S13 TaxID=2510959 RepID=UPI001F1D40F2|nr:helix-turn-helix domain-containing protein [Exiguobacterium sp. SH5S13]